MNQVSRANLYQPLSAILVLATIAMPLSAASFNCSKAKSVNEELICSNDKLSVLDEHYAATYKAARKNSHNSKEVVADAKTAWRWREANCSSAQCLQRWYIKRVLSLQNLADGSNSHKLEKSENNLTLLALYKGLRLKTLGYASNGHYPFEAFANHSVTFESSKSLVFDDDGIAIRIELLGDNKIRFTQWARGMQPKYINDGQISAVYFDQQNNDWRASSNGLAEDKTPRIKTNDLTTQLTYTSRHQSRYSHELEASSVGEFLLSAFRGPANQSGCSVANLGISPENTKLCEILPINLYNKANGTQLGSMRIALVKGLATGTTDAEVWLLNKGGLTVVEPILLERRKEDIVLLVFDSTKTKQNGPEWLNVSPSPANPAWINREELNSHFNKIYFTREQVVNNANQITLSSNHNLRVQPSTNSNVIQVIESEKGAIYPMNVSGDWMQVQYINPPPPNGWYGGTHSPLDASYTQLQGWIKWRKHIGKEYVSFEYWYD